MEQQTRGEGLARGLGWFSIGLGLAEIASPQSVAQLVGIEDGTRTRALIRGYGAREIACRSPTRGGYGRASRAMSSTCRRSRLRFNVRTRKPAEAGLHSVLRRLLA